VMLVGIGFLTVITAAITSTFVSRTEGEQASSGVEVATAQQLREIDSRLDARLARIEAALTDSA